MTDISEEWLVYTDFGQGNADIWAYNIQTGEKRQLTTNPYNQRRPAASGHRVVYEDDRNGYYDI
jgi:beta propeller repeat protein